MICKDNIVIDKKGSINREGHTNNKIQFYNIDFENPQTINITNFLLKELKNM